MKTFEKKIVKALKNLQYLENEIKAKVNSDDVITDYEFETLELIKYKICKINNIIKLYKGVK